MKQPDDIEEPQSTLMKVAGAVADSFARRESQRLYQLEERLRMLGKLASYLLIGTIFYWAYQLWIEIGPELDGTAVFSASTTNEESRGSSYFLLGLMLGGPALLVVGYIALGFFYNITVETLTSFIPLLRFAIVPLLMWTLLNALEAWRDEVKGGVIEAYAMVRGHVDKAMALQDHIGNAKDWAGARKKSQLDGLTSPEAEGDQ